MTRREQIEISAREAKFTWNSSRETSAFIKGAEWADANPKDRSVFISDLEKIIADWEKLGHENGLLIQSLRSQLAVAVEALKEAKHEIKEAWAENDFHRVADLFEFISEALARIESMKGDGE